MSDACLFLGIIFLIWGFSGLFIFALLRKRTPENVILMVVFAAIVIFLLYGLSVQNPSVAVFHK